MALTPDNIIQKSFTSRFRGVDPEEVKEFLQLAAAQMTELQEQLRQQSEKIDEQDKELGLAADDKKSFDDVIDVFKQKIETLTGELTETRQSEVKKGEEFERIKRVAEQMRQERDTLQSELGRVNRFAEQVQQEHDNLKSELVRSQTSLSEAESKARMSQAAVEGLRNKIMVIEAEKSELMAETEQYQRTIAEARHSNDELLEESRQQAEQVLNAAKEEIAQLRERASVELKELREDIEKLGSQRRELQTGLRDLLHAHLDRLSEFSTGTAGPSRTEYDDLFQKIDFTELSELEEHQLLDGASGDQTLEEDSPEDSEETLRSTLKDGGIAYLSDE